jgi:hypothetical protein
VGSVAATKARQPQRVAFGPVVTEQAVRCLVDLEMSCSTIE